MITEDMLASREHRVGRRAYFRDQKTDSLPSEADMQEPERSNDQRRRVKIADIRHDSAVTTSTRHYVPQKVR